MARYALYAQLTHGESCLVYTCGLGSRSQDVGLGWNVVWLHYSLDLIKKAVQVSADLEKQLQTNSLWR
jgi:hypothetical protein